MKKIFIIAIGCLSISLGGHVFACGDSGGCGGQDEDYCSEPESPCACTDPGWRYNNCMSKGEYCQVFGNDGAMDN